MSLRVLSSPGSTAIDESQSDSPSAVMVSLYDTPGVTLWNEKAPSSFVTTVRRLPSGPCNATVASGTGSLLLSAAIPWMLPAFVFADSKDCADADATRINPPARAMSRNRVGFKSVAENQ